MNHHSDSSREILLRAVCESITAGSTLILAIVGIWALAFTLRQIHEMRDESKAQQEDAKVQISEMREEAKVQHLLTFLDRFNSPERIAIRKSLGEKRVQGLKRLRKINPDNPDDIPVEFDDELGFCEDIGLLTARGYLDAHDVWNEFGQWIFYLYADSHAYLKSIPDSDYGQCKSLEEKIRPIEISEGGGTYNDPSEEDLVWVLPEQYRRRSGAAFGSHKKARSLSESYADSLTPGRAASPSQRQSP